METKANRAIATQLYQSKNLSPIGIECRMAQK